MRSAEMYLDAVKYSIANTTLDNKIIEDGTYKVINNGNICLEYDENKVCISEMKIDTKGLSPNDGYIKLEKGKITEVRLEYSNNFIYVDKEYYNGEIVYYDVVEGTGCTYEDYNVLNSNTGYNGINNKQSITDTTLTDKLENQNSCLKFYAFNDEKDSKIVKLLLDHNTTARLVWSSEESNNDGPKELIEQLKIDTEAWKGTQTLSNYTVTQTKGGKYTINYSNYKARLITAGEIAQITNNITFDETVSTAGNKFYFDTNSEIKSTTCVDGDISGCKYGWLYDRTNNDCTNRGCLNNASINGYIGYWTGTSVAGNSDYAWRVTHDGTLFFYNINMGTYFGVRPVIEVLKTNL